MDPFSGERKFHCGIDISVNEGTGIRAAAEGRVIFSGWKEGYGNAVIVRHRNGYITVYAHNSKNMAQQDALVKKGEIIALSGQTGAVTGAHLHFEIRKYLTPLNPLRFL
jgi:murein DD-endopeptidase MepM/ murein hydrolase activator NlpD